LKIQKVKRNGERDAVRFRVVAPIVIQLTADVDFFRLSARAIDFQLRVVPPGFIGIFLYRAGDRHVLRCDFAREIHAEEVSFLVGKRVAVVLI
jgi:hypothetical protein